MKLVTFALFINVLALSIQVKAQNSVPSEVVFVSREDLATKIFKLRFVSDKEIDLMGEIPNQGQETLAFKRESDGFFRRKNNVGAKDELLPAYDWSTLALRMNWMDGTSKDEHFERAVKPNSSCLTVNKQSLCRGTFFTTVDNSVVHARGKLVHHIEEFYLSLQGEILGFSDTGELASPEYLKVAHIFDPNHPSVRCAKQNVCIGDQRRTENVDWNPPIAIYGGKIVDFLADGIVVYDNGFYYLYDVAKTSIPVYREMRVVPKSCNDLSPNEINNLSAKFGDEEELECRHKYGVGYCEADMIQNEWGHYINHVEGDDHKSCIFPSDLSVWVTSPLAPQTK